MPMSQKEEVGKEGEEGKKKRSRRGSLEKSLKFVRSKIEGGGEGTERWGISGKGFQWHSSLWSLETQDKVNERME